MTVEGVASPRNDGGEINRHLRILRSYARRKICASLSANAGTTEKVGQTTIALSLGEPGGHLVSMVRHADGTSMSHFSPRSISPVFDTLAPASLLGLAAQPMFAA